MNITKQIKLFYYIQSYTRAFLGKKGDYKQTIDKLKSKIDSKTLEQIQKRVDYYCKLDHPVPNSKTHQIKELKKARATEIIESFMKSMKDLGFSNEEILSLFKEKILGGKSDGTTV